MRENLILLQNGFILICYEEPDFFSTSEDCIRSVTKKSAEVFRLELSFYYSQTPIKFMLLSHDKPMLTITREHQNYDRKIMFTKDGRTT